MNGPALLQPTGDPDVCRFRAHWSYDWTVFVIAFGLAAVAAGWWVRPTASIPFAGLALLCLWIRCSITTVCRRRRTFIVSPWRREPKHSLESLSVRRHVKRSRSGYATVTFQVLAGERIVADGMTEPQAHQLARELGEFLDAEG